MKDATRLVANMVGTVVIVFLIANPLKAAPADSHAADEQAIRKAATDFVEAFNQRDAKKIAALWTQDADYIDGEGTVFSGRDEIAEEFKQYFKRSHGRTVNIYISSIRFIHDDVAVEDGHTEVSPPPAGPPKSGRYTAVHVKQGGKWRLASLRESAQLATSNYEHLKDLEWLIGEWVDEAGESIVHTSSRWSKNKNYILRDFTVRLGERPVMSGTQRIGWDPIRQQIRSWVFDTEGGRAEGLWVRDRNRWVIRATGALHDGSRGSATNIITMLDDDTFTWQSMNRVIGGEATPDIDEIKVIRRPPKAK